MPKMMKMVLSLIVYGQALISGVDAFAQRDTKGRSSRTEAEAAMDKWSGGQASSDNVNALFTKADLDKNGVLSRPEMANMIAQLNAAAVTAGEEPVDYFEVMDDDHDGNVDRGEAAAFFLAFMGADKEEL